MKETIFEKIIASGIIIIVLCCFISIFVSYFHTENIYLTKVERIEQEQYVNKYYNPKAYEDYFGTYTGITSSSG